MRAQRSAIYAILCSVIDATQSLSHALCKMTWHELPVDQLQRTRLWTVRDAGKSTMTNGKNNNYADSNSQKPTIVQSIDLYKTWQPCLIRRLICRYVAPLLKLKKIVAFAFVLLVQWLGESALRCGNNAIMAAHTIREERAASALQLERPEITALYI